MTKIVLFFQAAVLRSNAWRDKLAGIYAFAEKAHWQVQIVPPDASAADVRYLLETWQPVGCIVDRSLSRVRNPIRLFRNTPVVLIDQNPETDARTASCVNHDSAATAALAAQELVATGMPRFSYVPYWLKTHWNAQRERSFAEAVRTAGKSYVSWGDAKSPPVTSKTLQDRQIAERLKAIPKPFGLLCANDQIAERVLAVAARLGISVPDELTVIGVDNDTFICDNTVPTLTSIHPDFYGGGYAAAQLLQDAIEHPHAKPKTESYGPRGIVRRQSTQRFGLAGTLVERARRLLAEGCADPAFRTSTLVRKLHCSRSLLEMRFRSETGRSIREEVQRLRIEKAKELLRNPNQAVTPVPALCGYTSESFFKRLFKRETGLTMREWKREMKVRGQRSEVRGQRSEVRGQR